MKNIPIVEVVQEQVTKIVTQPKVSLNPEFAKELAVLLLQGKVRVNRVDKTVDGHLWDITEPVKTMLTVEAEVGNMVITITRES